MTLASVLPRPSGRCSCTRSSNSSGSADRKIACSALANSTSTVSRTALPALCRGFSSARICTRSTPEKKRASSELPLEAWCVPVLPVSVSTCDALAAPRNGRAQTPAHTEQKGVMHDCHQKERKLAGCEPFQNKWLSVCRQYCDD